MKTRDAELEVKISGGRIVDATVLEDGTCKLTVEMNECGKYEVEVSLGIPVSLSLPDFATLATTTFRWET